MTLQAGDKVIVASADGGHVRCCVMEPRIRSIRTGAAQLAANEGTRWCRTTDVDSREAHALLTASAL